MEKHTALEEAINWAWECRAALRQYKQDRDLEQYMWAREYVIKAKARAKQVVK